MDDVVLDHLRIDAPEADFTEWRELVERVKNLKVLLKSRWLVSTVNSQMLTYQLMKH